MFQFEITLNEDDYILFNEYHLLNNPLIKKYFIFFKFAGTLIFFVFGIKFLSMGYHFQLNFIQAIVMMILSILWLFNSKKVIFKFMRKQVKKIEKDGRLNYGKGVTLKFDDECIYELTSNVQVKRNYSLIEKIAVTEKAIYIYVGALQAYILPVSVFSSETEKLKFLEFIKSKANNLKDNK